MKIDYSLYDVCLPDYFGGHHKPHVQIAVWPGMTMREVKSAIRNELSYGYVSGSDENSRLLSADFVGAHNDLRARRLFTAANAGLRRLKPGTPYQRTFFNDLEPVDDNDDCHIYAFFILEVSE